MMHAHASSQAMRMTPRSSAENAIPFGAALTLSLIAVAVAIGQIRGCFLPGVFRPWQLAICCIFFASSSGLLGVVFSRLHDNHRHQDTYRVLVCFCSVWPGIYEIEFLYKLFNTISRITQRVCVGTIILMLLLAGGLCIWLGEKTNESSLILEPLLFATCGVYTGLLMGYLYLAFELRKASRLALCILLANGLFCGLILILTIVLLFKSRVSTISTDLALWIFLTFSGAFTIRFPVLQSQKELIKSIFKSIFGFTGQTESCIRSLTMANQSARQNSTASLVPSPAVHISADVEAGTNDQ